MSKSSGRLVARVMKCSELTHSKQYRLGRVPAASQANCLGPFNPHFLVEVSRNSRMIGPTPVFMRFCGAKDTPEACTQWVNNKTSPFSSLSTRSEEHTSELQSLRQ